MKQVSRYNPVLVALHWALALIIIAALALGALVMVHIPNTSPMKLEALRSHMIGGALILVLMGVRFVLRQVTTLPAPAATGSAILDGLAWLSHRGFYLMVFAQVITGLVMAFQAHLPEVVFLGHGHLPPDFWAYPTRPLHYFFSRVLMTLIALHVAGVIYHTVLRRDRLLRRMGFGRRTIETGAPSLQSQSELRVTS